MYNLKDIITHIAWMKNNLGEIDIPVVQHCNLNCASCDHFAPLSKEHFFDLKQYKKVLTQLKKILGDKKVFRFNLMGGEPLLHPDLLEFCRITRQMFEDSGIFVTTNGILLQQQSEEWKNEMQLLNVTIDVTKYYNGKKFYKLNLMKNKKENESYRYCNNRNINVLDIKKQVPKEYYEFYSDFPCMQLNENGDFYFCIVPANIEIFNQYFDVKYEVVENADYVNIFKVKNINELLDNMNKEKIPFCDYCGKKSLVKWEGSKQDEKEWVE
jgi:organic radical activating enzyme